MTKQVSINSRSFIEHEFSTEKDAVDVPNRLIIEYINEVEKQLEAGAPSYFICTGNTAVVGVKTPAGRKEIFLCKNYTDYREVIEDFIV